MEVDYPRVTHPFAGLLTLAGFLPRLACVRHAASVRSEPGSNSPIKLHGVIAVLTSLQIHSKHCGFRNLFHGPAIQFSRTERHCSTADDRLPSPPSRRGALPTAVCASVSRPRLPARSRPPGVQGARHVTPALLGVKQRSFRGPARTGPAESASAGAARGRPDRPPCCRGRGSPRAARRGPARRPACSRAGTPRSPHP
jgi:hypothetical protein